MEKRKARIDTDVMERFVPSCRRCKHSGECRGFIRLFIKYYIGKCENYKRKV